jgi:hypothetical protein
MNKQRMIELLFEMMDILVDKDMPADQKVLKLYDAVVEAMDITGVLEKKQ